MIERIAFGAIKEVGLALVGRIAWGTISERFATRLVIYGLKKLKEKTSNDVVDSTVDDIIRSLKGKRLKVADEE